MKYVFEKNKGKNIIILLHGTGGNEIDFLPIGRKIDPEASLLSIRGDVNENGMFRYFVRHEIGKYDLHSFKSETKKLNDTIGKLSIKYNFNLENAIVVGFSNGANIAQGLLHDYPKLVNKYVLLSPDYINIEKEFNDLDNVGVFISTADNDPYVNPLNIVLLNKRLTKANALVTIEKGNGHQITFELLDNVKKWITE